jgi:hypothetical protein
LIPDVYEAIRNVYDTIPSLYETIRNVNEVIPSVYETIRNGQRGSEERKQGFGRCKRGVGRCNGGNGLKINVIYEGSMERNNEYRIKGKGNKE